MDFGRNLKKIRKSLKLTQVALAQLMNISQRTISHYENGDTDPDLLVLCRLSYAIDIPIATLLSYDNYQDADAYADLAKLASTTNINL